MMGEAMIKLSIKQPGVFVSIPGIPEFRTPANVDISKHDAALIISIMRQHGISDYEIISGISGTKPRPSRPKPKVTPKGQKPRTEDSKRLDRIERMLEKVLEQGLIVQVDNKTTKKKKEVEDEFIPSIETEHLSSGGKITTEEDTITDSDVKESADLLRKMRKGD